MPDPSGQIERRLKLCNMGSFFGDEPTAWSTDPEDPEAIAYREKYAGLPVYDHCPTSHYDWDLHQRHLIVEERPVQRQSVKRWWTRLITPLTRGER